MSQFTKDSDAKLRAACDRCHELKIRCTRTGGTESRCDRCDKNDIDCVYRAHRRIGRPKSQKSRPGAKTTTRQNETTVGGPAQQEQQEQVEISPPSARDSINSDFDFSTIEVAGGAEWLSSSSSHRASDAIEFSTHQVSSTQPPLFPPNYSFSHEGSTSHSGGGSPFSILNMGSMPVCDLDFSTIPDQGMSTEFDTSMNRAKDPGVEPMANNAEHQGNRFTDQTPIEETKVLEDRLLRHQAKLRYLHSTVDTTQNLLIAPHESVSPGAPLDRVLEATVELIDIIQTSAGQAPNNNNNSSSSSSNTGNASSETGNENHPRQILGRFGFNDIATLHISISYAYIVKILAPVISSLEKSLAIVGSTSLESKYPTPIYHNAAAHPNTTSLSSPTCAPTKSHSVSVSLGSFSLASKPALNALILLGLISRILKQLHDVTHPIALQEKDHHDANMGAADHVSAAHGPSLDASPVLFSAKAAVDSISKEERNLFAKLNKVGQVTSGTW
ncbi:hypothetical protein KAF25_000204 [Fusarium avenaceum]|uniref:Zn(2)-C6 fungal-type domain-containing protein n=1 Tax=Fusarium avenaceum TaxID=40199 RepID=A0A9P7KQ43_9HYPO|nr:hypothetical protein KAF25_000204 [Fusarium avenaceum]